ncbi:MAG TPA: YfhO family protein [Thermoanaerobaculia bacterium]|nr:YfhO family protein [Thermoanaerobaculia bacterium]
MTEARHTIAAALLVAILGLILYAIDPAFFVRDDFQLQYLPGSREVARAWTSGELPLLSRYSWVCAGLGAEYQFAIFSIFRALLDLLVWALPLSLTGRGAFLFLVHAAIAAAGAYRLARHYGAELGASYMVALVAGLNGWLLWWGTTWFPGIAGFAWLPWYWLGLRRAGFSPPPGRGGWAEARPTLGMAIALYLLVSAGWPYAVLMAMVVAAMHVLPALVRQQWRSALAMCLGSLIGLGLAAPAVLMLLEYFPYTARESVTTAMESIWFVPPAGFFGLVIPAFAATWDVFIGALPHPAVELLGAFVPLAALLAGARREFLRRYLPELVLLAVLAVLMLLPSAGPFRWSFRWLPLFHLVLAILGAVALEKRAAKFALAAIAVTAAAALAFDREPQATLLHAGIVAALCVIWLFAGNRFMPAAITAGMILLTFATFSKRGEVPVWRLDEALREPGVLDPGRRYLAMYDFDFTFAADAHGRFTRGLRAELRPGNLPMLAGVEFINGYSPLGPASLRDIFDIDVHGPMSSRRAETFLRYETRNHELLHQLGVDGLVVPEVMARRHANVLARNGWTPAARVAGALVLHREPLPAPVFQAAVALKIADQRQTYAAIFDRKTPQLPVVLFTPGNTQRYAHRRLLRVDEGRNHTEVRFAEQGAGTLLVFRRPWLPGWRATVDGKPVPVLRANMIMPAVEVPADASVVRLTYRPTSLVVGAAIAALSLIVLVVVAVKT